VELQGPPGATSQTSYNMGLPYTQMRLQLCRNTGRDGADVMSSGRVFQST